MNWEEEGFVDDRRAGFICAIHNYHGIPVVFQEGIAYTMVDAEGPLDIASIKSLIKKSFKIDKETGGKIHVYDMSDWEEYYELASEEGRNLSKVNIEKVGLTAEDMVDMRNRFQDLSGYYCGRFVPMG